MVTVNQHQVDAVNVNLSTYKKGHGTQRIEDLVADLLPRSTRIRRIDADVMTKKIYLGKPFRIFAKER